MKAHNNQSEEAHAVINARIAMEKSLNVFQRDQKHGPAKGNNYEEEDFTNDLDDDGYEGIAKESLNNFSNKQQIMQSAQEHDSLASRTSGRSGNKDRRGNPGSVIP